MLNFRTIFCIMHNVFGLCVRAGFGAQNCQPALHLNRSTKLQVSTSARLTQNPCYAFVLFCHFSTTVFNSCSLKSARVRFWLFFQDVQPLTVFLSLPASCIPARAAYEGLLNCCPSNSNEPSSKTVASYLFCCPFRGL